MMSTAKRADELRILPDSSEIKGIVVGKQRIVSIVENEKRWCG